MENEFLKYFGDDITFCTAECMVDCRRNPKYIFHKNRPHSYSDFSGVCMAYEPKENDDAHGDGSKGYTEI